MKRQIIAYVMLTLACVFAVSVVEGLDIAMQNQGASFSCIVLDGVPPFIYVWQSSIDGDFGYVANFTYDKLSAGSHVITVKVADSRTDTQIPAFNITNNSIQSIISTISVDMYNPTSCLLRVQGSGTYDYGPPYRCINTANTCFYRLFDKNTTWVKIFAVTPMLEDKRYVENEGEWYFNWSRTSAPNDEVNVTIYIGGGCQRTSSFLFNYTDSVTSFYVEPINDWINVTIFDGMNPPVVYSPFEWYNVSFGVNCSAWCKSRGYNVTCLPCPDGSGTTANIYCLNGLPACFRTGDSSCGALPSVTDSCIAGFAKQQCACVNPAVIGINLLPFPPADSIEDENGTIIHFHPYEGIRYSYFAINHAIPENASYLDIRVNYTCETKLWRNSTCFVLGLPLDEINDTSTVRDNFTIEFLDHQNPKDNCRWTNPLEWSNISGLWNRTWDSALGKYVFHLNKSNIPNRRMVSVKNVSDNKIIEALVKGNALGGEIADATIGFYGNKDASNYWFLDLHEDSSGGRLAIGYSVGGVSMITNSVPTSFTDDQWYWVSIFTVGNGSNSIYARIWPYGTEEPLGGWNITYTMNTGLGEAPFGYYLVIGSESGLNDEEFWFDPDPRCGINITGYYDTEFLAPLGYSVVTDGSIEIRIVPDVLSGITMSIGKVPRTEYMQIAYPSKHILYRKEKAVQPSAAYLDTFEFDYEDRYGYNSKRFGFNEKCNLLPCPTSACECKPENIFSPRCIDFTKENQEPYFPTDCICSWDECYPDPCTSFRTYHEYEGIYYDFVDFYAKFLREGGNYSRMVEDNVSHKWIYMQNVSNELQLGRTNSPERTFRLSFSAVNLRDTDFGDNGTITIYTHFRNHTYRLEDVLTLRGKSNISYTVTPAPDNINPGDTVTIDLDLMCGVFPIPSERVYITATNYQNELLGVSWEKNEAYVVTDAAGHAQFSFIMRQDSAQITLHFKGNTGCDDTKVTFVLGSDVKSIITSIEFFLLIIIFLFAISSYRFFKRGRLDFYEWWQELRGEKD